MATTSIANSLGIGSGIDVASLVSGLAEASRAPKEAAIAKRETANTAQISTIANLKNAIESFATSLDTLATGGSLQTQAVVSDGDVLGVATKAGASLDGFSGQIEVRTLATAQSIYSGLKDGAAPLGVGTMTFSNGVSVTTTATDTLATLATKITAAGKDQGLSATVIRDGSQSRLVLRGATGADNAFTVTADGGLADFAYSGTDASMTRAQAAGDAVIALDGVEIRRPKNVIDDLFDGVTLTLKRAAVDYPVTLSSERPTTAIKQAVYDFAQAYNTLEAMLDDADAAGLDGTKAGPLRGSQAIREMRAQLARIAGTALRTGDGPTTLAAVGVKTGRDGSLTVDAKMLDAAVLANPAAVEALFRQPDTATAGFQGVAEAIDAVRTTLTGDKGVLTQSDVRLKSEQKMIARDREAMEMREDAYAARLQDTFGTMEAQLAVFASTQSWLEQQIKVWSNDKD